MKTVAFLAQTKEGRLVTLEQAGPDDLQPGQIIYLADDPHWRKAAIDANDGETVTVIQEGGYRDFVDANYPRFFVESENYYAYTKEQYMDMLGLLSNIKAKTHDV